MATAAASGGSSSLKVRPGATAAASGLVRSFGSMTAARGSATTRRRRRGRLAFSLYEKISLENHAR